MHPLCLCSSCHKYLNHVLFRKAWLCKHPGRCAAARGTSGRDSPTNGGRQAKRKSGSRTAVCRLYRQALESGLGRKCGAARLCLRRAASRLAPRLQNAVARRCGHRPRVEVLEGQAQIVTMPVPCTVGGLPRQTSPCIVKKQVGRARRM